MSSRRQRLADAIGLALILLVLLDYLKPALLFLPTITAGGDTPCHYPTAVYLKDYLLPRGRLHGWYPGAYLGQPLLLYYFPLAFLLMAALAPLVGMPVAFKLGTALGVLLLPPLVYLGVRLMGFRFPAPLMGATAATVFLFVEENPIWGGTLASTLTGEFSYTYGIGLAVLFLGLVYRAYGRGDRPLAAALLLALAALAHGYAVLWAGLSTSYFLYASRRPLKTLGWLATLAGLAFALAAFFLLPLLAGWGWTTSYDDPWITVGTRNLFPSLVWPLFAFALVGLVLTVVLARRMGGPDHRLLFLLHAALMAAALAAAGPAFGVIDVRFVPFAQLALCLAGGATLGLLLAPLAASDLAAVGMVLVALVYGDSSSRVLRSWIDWNYTGLEAKELWPAWERLTRRIQGGVADPRVAVEYSAEHEKAGSIRMYETLPLFSGRSTLEGVYNQASLATHVVYYLASELDAKSPNPFRNREYSSFDTGSALAHLRLFHVSDVVALSDKLVESLSSREGVRLTARIPPYTVFHLEDAGAGYVEPLAFEPVRSSPVGWREKAYRWFTRKPPSRALLVFSDDPRFRVQERDQWLAPPEVPLPGGVKVSEKVEPERITITTNRPGHPLLVKISYHPRWHASGADGPYLVSPALMMVIPRQRTVVLTYAARDWSDWLGWALTLLAVGTCLVLALRFPRRGPSAPVALREPSAGPRRWGGMIPAALLLLLVGARFRPALQGKVHLGDELYERASKAYSEGRYADAAEYARHATSRTDAALRGELLSLRGESLVRLKEYEPAAASFREVLEIPGSPYAPQALWGLYRCSQALGDAAGAATARERLLKDYGETPWADHVREGTDPKP